MVKPPHRLDRYPGKMVSRLAEELASRYLTSEDTVLDPFCGSAAVLAAAQRRVRSVTGVDLNPYAVLLASVKLNGFDGKRARIMLREALESVRVGAKPLLPMRWDRKEYWFTPATLRKLEELRFRFNFMQLGKSPEGQAILLALALSARPCSRADQRSPKPFISRRARKIRKGRHFDPMKVISATLDSLISYYSSPFGERCEVYCGDARESQGEWAIPDHYTAVVTSPPYINAQDYFRNSKLELYVLEGLLPFEVEEIKPLFIGTERGVRAAMGGTLPAGRSRDLISGLAEIEKRSATHALIVQAYFCGMYRCLSVVKRVLAGGGTLVLVCGDNLICGVHLKTWRILIQLITREGFELLSVEGDRIRSRLLPPSRAGHRGLIKEEKVLVFRA